MSQMNRIFGVLLLGAMAFTYVHFAHQPKPRRFAPEGTVFLLDYASLPTAHGVIGFPPGTALRVVETQPTQLILTDGKYRIPVGLASTTNDLDVVEQVRQMDASEQARLAAEHAGAMARLAASAEQQVQLKAEDDARQARLAAQAARNAPRRINPLDLPATRSRSSAGGYTSYNNGAPSASLSSAVFTVNSPAK